MESPNAIVDKVQTHLKNVASSSAAYLETGLKLCNSAVRSLNLHLKLAKSIPEKQHITACHAKIKSFKARYQSLRVIGFGEPRKTAHHNVKWGDSISAFKNRVRTGVITNLHHTDPELFLNDCEALFRRRIQIIQKKEQNLKVNTVLCADFIIEKSDKLMQEFKCFETPNMPISKDTNLSEWFKNNVQQVLVAKLEDFQEKDSGWAINKILNLQVNINKYNPLRGSSYIDLPPQIKRKEACVNVQNQDEACFAWTVVSALFPVEKNPQRILKYPHYSQVLKLKGIHFPMTMGQISHFEKQNNISINIYTLKLSNRKYITFPFRLTKEKRSKHINLLMIHNQYMDEYTNDSEDMEPLNTHFVWIKDLSRLVSRELSKHKSKKYFCDRCFHYYYTQTGLEQHIVDCSKNEECLPRLPKEEDKILKFKNYKNKIKVPFTIYADLECILKPTGNDNKYQEHIPCSVGYYVKCSFDDSLSCYKSYRGSDCMTWFSAELKQFAEDVETVFMCPYEIHMTTEQEAGFKKATHCHICEQQFSPEDKIVRDHDHLLPENNYRGPAHEACNINFKDAYTIPVIFHNLSGYDSHFIIKNIAMDMDGTIDLLPITKEKYISFTKNVFDSLISYRFIDSFRFMNSSLDTLASYLADFPIMKKEFNLISAEHFQLLTKKGVYPYDFMDSFEKFKFASLPPKEEFFNKLERCCINGNQYKHAQRIWSTFNIKDLGEYSDLYLKTDVMLLAEVFEQFRTSCHNTYGLDPAHYFTLPGFTWDCMLYKTRQELELLTDYDMVMFIEKGIRGGLSQVCSKRRAKANNKYLPTYDANQPESYLMYLDINNQYGWAMSQSLPYGGFEWLQDNNIDVTKVPDDADDGYILEVDLEYPQEFHDVHKDLPFCPEHINSADLIDSHIASEGIKNKPSSVKKLMGTLSNKKSYVIHYRNLKQAIAHGLRVTSTHRLLKFKQSPWLKSYISLNTELRKNAKNDFEKNLYKLMNNAVFGKTMENIRKHSNVRLVTKWDGRYGAESRIANPLFKSIAIFDENLVAVELNKAEIYFNKPIYVGMCILDLAKTTIYDFHYGYMHKEFGNDCSVLYTDTDSLIYEIVNRNPYEVMKRDCFKYFDTSDYPQDNVYNIPLVNKKVLGKMKDENNGKIMTDFIGLRSKMYVTKTFKTHKEKEQEVKELLKEGINSQDMDIILSNFGITKKAKGVKKCVVKTHITFEDYEKCVEHCMEKSVYQNLIKSEKHQVHTITQNKIALSPHDDKRKLIANSHKTLPWGHYSIIKAHTFSISIDDNEMDIN